MVVIYKLQNNYRYGFSILNYWFSPDHHMGMGQYLYRYIFSGMNIHCHAQDFSLRHLRDLSLAGNRLLEVPAEIAQALPSLQQLLLHGNQLRQLPDAGTEETRAVV